MNTTHATSLTLLAVALTSFSSWSCSREIQSKSMDDLKKDTIAVPIEASIVKKGEISAFYTATANLIADDQAQVVAQVAGLIQEIRVEEGDIVEKGQVLAKLDAEQLRLEVDMREATLKRVENDYKRNKGLYEKAVISAEQFDNSRFEYESQKASLDLARLNYNFATIKAPISGVVSRREVRVGNNISPNQAMFTITAFNPLIADVFLPEQELVKVKRQQETIITADAYQGKQFNGKIERISPVVDPVTGTFKVTVSVANPEGLLKPGMFTRMRIVFDKKQQALLVPKEAVLTEDGKSSVFVVQDEIVLKQPVQLGYINGRNVEILKGVQLNDKVVTIGMNNLKDSTRVEIITLK